MTRIQIQSSSCRLLFKGKPFSTTVRHSSTELCGHFASHLKSTQVLCIILTCIIFIGNHYNQTTEIPQFNQVQCRKFCKGVFGYEQMVVVGTIINNGIFPIFNVILLIKRQKKNFKNKTTIKRLELTTY